MWYTSKWTDFSCNLTISNLYGIFLGWAGKRIDGVYNPSQNNKLKDKILMTKHHLSSKNYTDKVEQSFLAYETHKMLQDWISLMCTCLFICGLKYVVSWTGKHKCWNYSCFVMFVPTSSMFTQYIHHIVGKKPNWNQFWWVKNILVS